MAGEGEKKREISGLHPLGPPLFLGSKLAEVELTELDRAVLHAV